MKQKFISALRKVLMIVALALFAVPALADNCEFERDYNFMAYSKGRGVVHFKLLVFAEGSAYNHWAGETNGKISYVYLEDADGNQTRVMSYHGDNNKNKHDGKKGYCWMNVSEGMGRFVVTNQYSGQKSQPFEKAENQMFDLVRESNGIRRVWVEFDWYMPEKFATTDQKVKMYVCDKRTNKYWNRTYDLMLYSAADPLTKPELFDAVFYPTAGITEGQRANMAVPYSTIYKPKRYVTSQNPLAVETDKMADMLMVEARDTVQHFYVDLDVETDEAHTMYTLRSNVITVPAYHSITDFKVTEKIDTLRARRSYDSTETDRIPVNRGHKRISWVIPNAQEWDAMDMDVFEVQRAYNADFSDAQTIGSVDYISSVFFASDEADDVANAEEGAAGELGDRDVVNQYYEFIDSTYNAAFNRLDPTLPVYYRVRRATAASWGWDHRYAASGYLPVNGSDGVVEQIGLAKPLLLRDGDYAVRYEQNHEVVIDITTPETSATSLPQQGIYPKWWDELAMLKVQRGDSQSEGVSIPVMTDSLRLIHTRDVDGHALYRWQYRFVDEMPTACENYDYRVTLDTSSINIRAIQQQTDQTGTYTPQLAMTSDGLSKCSFDRIPTIDMIEASQGLYNSHTLITWEPSASGIETYSVLRNGKVIASDIVETAYLDSTGVAGQEYEYSVCGKLVCRTEQTTYSATCTGYRAPYGSISGRVVNLNGTAMAGVSVYITRDGESVAQYPDAVLPERIKDVYTTITDTDGRFVADSLVYSVAGTNFTVTVGSTYGVFTPTEFSASISTSSTDVSIKDFVNSAIVEFSGRVLYEGSTLPVTGVHFLLNGLPLKNASGSLITSDNLGNFSVTLPKNHVVTLQAVKEGHHFLQDGYFYLDGEKEFSLAKNQPGMRMYDQTKVRLIGRVAGGDIEGSRPLGFGQSVNNLGDNLQLVLELEGDNISHLVYDESDPTYQSRSEQFEHFKAGERTSVYTTTKRITVRPDSITGEYQLDLFPARYRVMQATADGYSSLLAAGTAIPVIDLTDSIRLHEIVTEEGTVKYNAQYRIVYHSPISATYSQILYGRPLTYIGEKQYDFLSVNMESKPLKLIRENAEQPYVLGYPLFKSGNLYNIEVQAHEDYYYNNESNGRHTQVMMKDCPVKVYNGFDTSSSVIEGQLDDEGCRTFIIPANNPDFSLTGKDALRTLSVSVYVDGEYVQATPLSGYVSGSRIKGGNSINNPNVNEVHRTIALADVLRDPPGRDSYAYIESGAHYTTRLNTYKTFEYGVDVTITYGTSFQNVTGISAGVGPFTGTVMEGSTAMVLPMPLTQKKIDYKDYTYSFNTKERIQTSTDPALAGQLSTVFIGTEPCIYTTINETFGVIDSEAYNRVLPAINAGNVRIVAEGMTDEGKPIYLAISEEMGLATGFEGHFVYSENYILRTLLPQLMRERNSLILTDSHETVQALANRTGKRQYRSLVPADSGDFGMEYEIVDPENVHNPGQVDRVDALNTYMMDWVAIVQREEASIVSAKYNKKSLLTTYNVSGASLDYAETTSFATGYQNKDLTNSMAGTVIGGIGKGISAGGSWVMRNLMDLVFNNAAANFAEMFQRYKKKSDDGSTMSGLVPGSKFRIDFNPVVDYQNKEANRAEEGKSRTVGFHIADDPYNRMTIDVYRLTDDANAFRKSADEFLSIAADVDKTITYKDTVRYTDFVYYVNGGATRAPHRGPATTMLYLPGTKIDNGTLNMEIPRINVNTYEISNVPEGESAIFDLQLSLESETQENVSFGRKYKLFLLDDSNTKGAGLFIDGQPIAGGRVFELVPGKSVFHKMLEVRQGVGYDFEDIKLRLRSEDDATCYADVNLSVHFIPSSSPVRLSLISDNWLLNTLSPRDTTGYYLPVEITGFDVNYRNFDHIEFQYKLTSQSNDSWVNLCSYYADEDLYQKASGSKGRITNGIISNIRFYGERDPMEQQYDLRAVSYCRLGSGYVSRASEVFSGRKDTRCPQVFGSVTPKNGILGPGDYISIPFSEDIAANYLDEDNNFQIYGYTNGSGITNTTSLLFDGSEDGVAVSQSQRTLGGEGFTIDMMIKPEDTSADYTYFSVTDQKRGRELLFGQSDGHLALTLKTDATTQSTITSKTLPEKLSWTRVAVSYNSQSGKVAFYLGTEDYSRLTGGKAKPGFTLTGDMCFGGGKDAKAYPYKGNMLEARVWNRPLDALTLANTNQRSLSGYELGLLAYYPMNEGNGLYANDKAHGADLQIGGASWSLPAGRSLHFDAKNENGVQLDEKEFAVGSNSDYTLSLWFKADQTQKQDTVAIFAAGRGIKQEANAAGHLFLGLEDGHLALRQNGFSVVSEGDYLDNEWHNVAVTVAHDLNAGALYVDGEVMRSFSGDVLKGITTNALYLGACHWQSYGDDGVQTAGPTYPFSGYIDDVKLYNTAISIEQHNLYRGITPLLDDITLQCYLPFQRSELSGNGRLETVYSPYNGKRYYDANGKPVNKDVRLVKSGDDAVAAMASNVTAPIRDAAEPTKLAFGWVGKDNELVVNINMTDYEINHQNLFLTVRDVEDNAGNMLVSPVSMTVYVDKNPIKWRDSYVLCSVPVGGTTVVEPHIYNRTGKTIKYSIDNLPDWISCLGADGYMKPDEDAPIFMTVHDDLEPGYHTALLQLTDENGLTDPILLVVEVQSREPELEVNPNLTQSMNVVGQIMIPSVTNSSEYVVDTQTDDIVYAFIGDVCAGKQHISRTTGTTANLMMTVHGDEVLRDKPVYFGLWQAETGRICVLDAEGATITFADNALYGSTASPVVMRTTDNVVQTVALAEGWNWVSLYAVPDRLENSFMQTSVFTIDDMVKTYYTEQGFATYAGNGKWQGSIDKLDYHQMYMFYVKQAGTMSILGKRLTSNAERTVAINSGWNELPYLLEYDEDVNTALSDYFDHAMENDMVKGYDDFAVFDARSGKWIGSLTKMRTGHGYMLKHNGTTSCNITYHSQQASDAVNMNRRSAPVASNSNGTNMPVVAVADIADVEVQRGDCLRAYAGERLVGMAEADGEGRFFLMTHAEDGVALSFTLERDGQVLSTAAPQLTYNSKDLAGTLQHPYVIDFNGSETEGDYYDLQGRRVVDAAHGGVYIRKNQKIIIR